MARHLATPDHPAKRAGAALGRPLRRPTHREGDQHAKLIHRGDFYAIFEYPDGSTKTEWMVSK